MYEDETGKFDSGEATFSHQIEPTQPEPDVSSEDIEAIAEQEGSNPTEREISRLKEFNVEIPETATFTQLFETVEFYSGEQAAKEAELMADYFLQYCIDQLDIPETLEELKAMKMSDLVARYPDTLTLDMISDFLPVIFD